MAARLTLLGLHPIFLKLPQADLILYSHWEQWFLVREQPRQHRGRTHEPLEFSETYVLAHLGVRVRDEVADDLDRCR